MKPSSFVQYCIQICTFKYYISIRQKREHKSLQNLYFLLFDICCPLTIKLDDIYLFKHIMIKNFKGCCWFITFFQAPIYGFMCFPDIIIWYGHILGCKVILRTILYRRRKKELRKYICTLLVGNYLETCVFLVGATIQIQVLCKSHSTSLEFCLTFLLMLREGRWVCWSH